MSEGEAFSSTKVEFPKERDRFGRRARLRAKRFCGHRNVNQDGGNGACPRTAKRHVASSRDCGCIVRTTWAGGSGPGPTMMPDLLLSYPKRPTSFVGVALVIRRVILPAGQSFVAVAVP